MGLTKSGIHFFSLTVYTLAQCFGSAFPYINWELSAQIPTALNHKMFTLCVPIVFAISWCLLFPLCKTQCENITPKTCVERKKPNQRHERKVPLFVHCFLYLFCRFSISSFAYRANTKNEIQLNKGRNEEEEEKTP